MFSHHILACFWYLPTINICAFVSTFIFLHCLASFITQEAREISLTQVPHFNKTIVHNCKEVISLSHVFLRCSSSLYLFASLVILWICCTLSNLYYIHRKTTWTYVDLLFFLSRLLKNA